MSRREVTHALTVIVKWPVLASVECLMLLLVCLFINLIVTIYTCTEVFIVKLKMNLIAQWL